MTMTTQNPHQRMTSSGLDVQGRQVHPPERYLTVETEHHHLMVEAKKQQPKPASPKFLLQLGKQDLKLLLKPLPRIINGHIESST